MTFLLHAGPDASATPFLRIRAAASLRGILAARSLQVPNFALASPMAIIAAAAVSAYIHRRPLHSASVGGLLPTRLVQRLIPAKLKDRRPSKGFYSDACFVFVAQLAAMAAFSVLFMHVQVRSRSHTHTTMQGGVFVVALPSPLGVQALTRALCSKMSCSAHNEPQGNR